MNRIEFMTTLASLLQDIPAEERREAMQYYNDYFDEAGSENEEQVIRELGSPEKVADTIKAGIDGYGNEEGEFTDTGYHEPRFEKQEVPEPRATQDSGKQEYQYTKEERKERWTSKPLKIILIAAIILCAIPVIVPIAAGLVAAVAGILLAFVAVLIAIVIASVAVAVSGVGIFVTGIISMFGEFAAGLAVAGVGLILFPLGAIATVASIKLCIIVFPAMIRGIVNLCRKPFHRKAVA